jgi:mRNA interferase HigB
MAPSEGEYRWQDRSTRFRSPAQSSAGPYATDRFTTLVPDALRWPRRALGRAVSEVPATSHGNTWRCCSHGGSTVYFSVRIIARRTLREFWARHADAEQSLRAWYDDAKRARWRSPAAIKQTYANASIVGDNPVVFNIKGNSYRLVVAINYPYGVCYIRFIGTHAEYDRVDVASVSGDRHADSSRQDQGRPPRGGEGDRDAHARASRDS